MKYCILVHKIQALPNSPPHQSSIRLKIVLSVSKLFWLRRETRSGVVPRSDEPFFGTINHLISSRIA